MSSTRSSRKPVWDRFWAKVVKAGPDDCWEWKASRDTRGYGHLGVNCIPVRAHRMAWILTNGDIPEGDVYHKTCVLHRCDNKVCCNPAHLFLGSHADNMLDMKRKQRRRGINKHEGNGRAKLTAEQVSEIRAGKDSNFKTAIAYGVSPAQIQRIRAGKQWVE